MDLDFSYPSYTKIYLQEITNLNIAAKIINLLKLGRRQSFLDRTQKAIIIKEKMIN